MSFEKLLCLKLINKDPLIHATRARGKESLKHFPYEQFLQGFNNNFLFQVLNSVLTSADNRRNMENITCPACNQTLKNVTSVLFDHFIAEHSVKPEQLGRKSKNQTCVFCRAQKTAKCVCERHLCQNHFYSALHKCSINAPKKIEPNLR